MKYFLISKKNFKLRIRKNDILKLQKKIIAIVKNKLNVLNCKKSKVYLLAIVFPIAKATLKVDKILSQKLGVFFFKAL